MQEEHNKQRKSLMASMKRDILAAEARILANLSAAFHHTPLMDAAMLVQHAIFPIKTRHTYGVAFRPFRHFIMSNAHVMISLEAIGEATLPTHLEWSSEHVFLRPAKPDACPDVMLAPVNGNDLDDSYHQDLHQLSCGNRQHPESKYFCINPHVPQDHPQWLIELHHHSDQRPIINFHLPEVGIVQGISGTPIFEAKMMLIDRKPQWRVTIKGMLFARNVAKQQVLALDLSDELTQINKIAATASATNRYTSAAQYIHDTNISTQATSLQQSLHQLQSSYAKGQSLKPYPHLICEPLNGTSIIKVTDSIYCRSSQYRDEKAKQKIDKNQTLSARDIESLFTQAVNSLATLDQPIPLKPNVSINLLQAPGQQSIFRMDIDASNHTNPARDKFSKKQIRQGKAQHASLSLPMWRINIQDNTWKTHGNSKSSSSVFAQVMIPRDSSKKEHLYFTEEIISHLLASQEESKTMIHHPDQRLMTHDGKPMKKDPSRLTGSEKRVDINLTKALTS